MSTDGTVSKVVHHSSKRKQKSAGIAADREISNGEDSNWPEQLLSLLATHVLPIRGVRITLRAGKDVNLRFQHAHALSAWIRTLAKDATDSKDGKDAFEQLRVDPIESGQIHYSTGDLYHFAIFCIAPGLPTLARVLDRLCYPITSEKPATSSSRAEKVAFGFHWEIESVQDWFSGQPVSNCGELAVYNMDTLVTEAAIWREAAYEPIIWQWLSPARLLKVKEKRGKGENRFCRDAIDVNTHLLFERCADALSHVARSLTDDVPGRDHTMLPAVLDQHHDVFWVQDDYHPANADAKPKGGLLGRHRLDVELSKEWACLLVLAQYIGIGQSTASGLGRFRLETLDGQMSLRRGHPARDWLDRSLQPSNLLDAWRHVRESRQSIPNDAQDLWDTSNPEAAETNSPANTHNEDPGELSVNEPETLQDILNWRIRTLKEGRYVAPAAHACLIPKSDGGSRMLAIPPFWDAVLQRAVTQQLAPSLDSLMHPTSFGYRRGRSRRSAAEIIQKARREGYRWIYDADIEDFFGSVNHDRLQGRLLALFDDDPIIDILMNWVRAPVRWNGVDHARKQGLPQGSNLSPLLANLMLDDFDNDMAAAGIRLVRFADDFVLMCKSREQAESASRAAADSLREHGFNLHEDKSRIADLDEGLDFLGYLFVGDYAIDTSGNRVLTSKAKQGKKRQTGNSKPTAEQSIQMAQWLAKISQNSPRSLTERELEAREAKTALARSTDSDTILVDEQFDPDGSLYLVGHGHLIYTEAGHLVVARDDERVLQRPWRHLRHVFLMGNQHITTPAMRVAAREGVSVYATSATGHLHFSVTAPVEPANQRLWLRQAIVSENTDFCLTIARKLVAARIRHQFEVYRKRASGDGNPDTANISELLRHLNQTADLQSLNGIEGQAAAVFFEQFAALLPDSFGFVKRARRPPPDPVNALLSIGYQLLYANADTFLKCEKLLPAVGIYHRTGRNHAALASDMIEPFRHIVEQSVLQMLRRRTLKAEHFEVQDGGRSCFVQPAARKTFIANLQSRLGKPVKPRGEAEALSYRTLLHRQCHSMALAIEYQDPERFNVFRLR